MDNQHRLRKQCADFDRPASYNPTRAKYLEESHRKNSHTRKISGRGLTTVNLSRRVLGNRLSISGENFAIKTCQIVGGRNFGFQNREISIKSRLIQQQFCCSCQEKLQMLSNKVKVSIIHFIRINRLSYI